jgi:hypothetical protein
MPEAAADISASNGVAKPHLNESSTRTKSCPLPLKAYLDCKNTNHCNNIETMHNVVLFELWVIIPYELLQLNDCNLSDGSHEIYGCKRDNMGETAVNCQQSI